MSKVHLFFGKDDVFSHFYPCEFEVDGIKYSCGEQYMMHQKAILFKDSEMAEKILSATKPGSMKSFGRKVRNFDEDIWKSTCREIVFNGNMAKFTQNEDLRVILLKTGDSMIGEASPYDKRWGIGLGKSNADAQNPKNWRGQNWLGEALMKVREELKD